MITAPSLTKFFRSWTLADVTAAGVGCVIVSLTVRSCLRHLSRIVSDELKRQEPLPVEPDGLGIEGTIDALLALRDRYRGVPVVARIHPSPIFEDSDWAMSHGYNDFS